MKTIKLSPDTEAYFAARRSLILSNGDKQFRDTVKHSDALVLDVIESFAAVFIKPMLARVERK